MTDLATGRSSKPRVCRRVGPRLPQRTLRDRAPGHRRKLAQEPIRKASRYRQLAVGFEFLDCGTGRLVKRAGRPQLTVTEFRQNPLHRHDARRRTDRGRRGRRRRRPDQIADRIVAARGGSRLRPCGGHRARWRHIDHPRRSWRLRIRRQRNWGQRGEAVGGRLRRRIGKERRRMNTRLQENGIDDDDQACGARAQNRGRVDGPMRCAAPQTQSDCGQSTGGSSPAGTGAPSASGPPLTHFSSPSRSRGPT